MHALTDTGRSLSAVAPELGLDRRTVRKYARAGTWQEVMRRPPRKPSILDPYPDYLQQRWTRENTTRRSCTRNSIHDEHGVLAELLAGLQREPRSEVVDDPVRRRL
ncbi:hypothetical protein [Streptomyces sp. NPDC002851]